MIKPRISRIARTNGEGITVQSNGALPGWANKEPREEDEEEDLRIVERRWFKPKNWVSNFESVRVEGNWWETLANINLTQKLFSCKI